MTGLIPVASGWACHAACRSVTASMDLKPHRKNTDQTNRNYSKTLLTFPICRVSYYFIFFTSQKLSQKQRMNLFVWVFFFKVREENKAQTRMG